jgi:hypothetical protein
MITTFREKQASCTRKQKNRPLERKVEQLAGMDPFFPDLVTVVIGEASTILRGKIGQAIENSYGKRRWLPAA